MSVHVYVFLLVICLFLSLVLLWRLCWLHLQPSHSRRGAIHSTVHRLLKPRTPCDCPACRLSCTHASVVEPVPAPVRPWSEVKSRRGAPKRIPTEGFACPNQQCAYVGITDAHLHALVGDGKHGQTEPIQTFRCQACRTTFTARRHTPLYRLKTPSQQVAMVLTALGSWAGSFGGSTGLPLSTSDHHEPFSRALEHAQTLHKHYFCNLQLPHLQLDELRTRLRSATPVLWLWLAIDPLTRDSSCACARPAYAKHGAPAHPFAATDPGRLSVSPS